MINYLKDMSVIGSRITTFPYVLKGPIAIGLSKGKSVRCPAWGWGKTIIKFDENYIYVKSDTAGKVDVFNEHGDKVKEISEGELK